MQTMSKAVQDEAEILDLLLEQRDPLATGPPAISPKSYTGRQTRRKPGPTHGGSCARSIALSGGDWWSDCRRTR